MTAPIDIEEALQPIIANDAGVAAIASERVFPNRLAMREEMPAVIFRRTSGGPMQTLKGVSTTKRATFQVESWSSKLQQEARQLDLAVQNAIATFGGQQAQSGWYVQSIFVDEESDQDNPQIPIHADDVGVFCSFCNVIVFYEVAP